MAVTTLDILDALNEFEADLEATLEAAANTGYKQFSDSVATDYNPRTGKRERVPVRGNPGVDKAVKDMADSTQKMKNIGQKAVDDRVSKKVGRDMVNPMNESRDSMREKALQRSLKKSIDEYNSPKEKLTRAVDKSMILGQEKFNKVSTQLSVLTAEQQKNAVDTFTKTKSAIGNSVATAYNKLDPEAGVHFGTAFNVASNNISKLGIKEGIVKTQEYLKIAASEQTISKSAGNARVRGIVVGVGAAIGGLVGAGMAAKSAIGNASNSAKTTISDFFKGLPAQAQAAQKMMGENFTKMQTDMSAAGSGMIASAMGMLTGMQASLMNSGFATTVGENFGEMNSGLNKLSKDMAEQIAEIQKTISDPAKRQAAFEKVITDAKTQFSDLIKSKKPEESKAPAATEAQPATASA